MQEFFQENDIHVHVPEGAVPKVARLPGTPMATAMLSAIIDRKVRADVAMTGEITLRGRVLPIGGLKEKLLAAKYARIKQVLVPKENKPDIQEIDAEILDGLKISYVDNMKGSASRSTGKIRKIAFQQSVTMKGLNSYQKRNLWLIKMQF